MCVCVCVNISAHRYTHTHLLIHTNRPTLQSELDCLLVWDLHAPISVGLASTLGHLLGEDVHGGKQEARSRTGLLVKTQAWVTHRLLSKGVARCVSVYVHVYLSTCTYV
jgi:hypothetical protein